MSLALSGSLQILKDGGNTLRQMFQISDAAGAMVLIKADVKERGAIGAPDHLSI
jgi:hypothetical protein